MLIFLDVALQEPFVNGAIEIFQTIAAAIESRANQ